MTTTYRAAVWPNSPGVHYATTDDLPGGAVDLDADNWRDAVSEACEHPHVLAMLEADAGHANTWAVDDYDAHERGDDDRYYVTVIDNTDPDRDTTPLVVVEAVTDTVPCEYGYSTPCERPAVADIRTDYNTYSICEYHRNAAMTPHYSQVVYDVGTAIHNRPPMANEMAFARRSVSARLRGIPHYTRERLAVLAVEVANSEGVNTTVKDHRTGDTVHVIAPGWGVVR